MSICTRISTGPVMPRGPIASPDMPGFGYSADDRMNCDESGCRRPRRRIAPSTPTGAVEGTDDD
jgi:hypothetical protein